MQTPTLIVHGDRDGIPHHLFLDMPDNNVVILPNSTYTPYLNQPLMFATSVINFLDYVGRSVARSLHSQRSMASPWSSNEVVEAAEPVRVSKASTSSTSTTQRRTTSSAAASSMASTRPPIEVVVKEATLSVLAFILLIVR